MQLPKSRCLRALVGSIIISVLFGGFYIFASWYAVLHSGAALREIAVSLIGVLGLTVFANLLYLIFNTFRWLFKIGGIEGSDVGALAIFCVTCGLLVIVAIVVGETIRISAFRAMARRAQPLIVAVERFQTAHGTPPATLSELVPQFIEKIPGTGMAAYPEFRYIVSATRSNYSSNEWILSVDISTDDLTRDELRYYPLRNYPPSGGGVDVIRIGHWAKFEISKHAEESSHSN